MVANRCMCCIYVRGKGEPEDQEGWGGVVMNLDPEGVKLIFSHSKDNMDFMVLLATHMKCRGKS